MSCFWGQAANIGPERLASFDRPIKSEPNFKKEQTEGLLRDLQAYLVTLKVRTWWSPCTAYRMLYS